MRNIETIVASAEETRLVDNDIAFLYMVDTLHHIERKENLKELHRVLTPGGNLVTMDTHMEARGIVDMASKQSFSVAGSENTDRFLKMMRLQKQWKGG